MASPAVAAAPPVAGLSATQLEFWHANGYLVLEQFASESQTAAMLARALQLVEGFDPATHGGVKSVFTTNEQLRKTDDYFLESGDKIRTLQ
jgi:phytanoyl-CoA hydroxylase